MHVLMAVVPYSVNLVGTDLRKRVLAIEYTVLVRDQIQRRWTARVPCRRAAQMNPYEYRFRAPLQARRLVSSQNGWRMPHVRFHRRRRRGGVGKSVVSRVLQQYFIDREIPFLDSNTTARRRFRCCDPMPIWPHPVVIEHYEGLDTIVEAAVADPDAALHGRSRSADTDDPSPSDHRALPPPRPRQRCRVLTRLLARDGLHHDSADLLENSSTSSIASSMGSSCATSCASGDFEILDRSGTLERAKAPGMPR